MTRRLGGILITVALVALASPSAAEAPEDEWGERDLVSRDKDCLICHAGVGEEDAPKLDMTKYRASVHAEEGCIGCHADVEDESIKHEEEDQDLGPATCNSCHEGQQADYEFSIHADAEAANDPDIEQATCASCHGSHDVVDTDSLLSVVHPLQQFETCGRCHEEAHEARGHVIRMPDEYRKLLAAGEEEALTALMEEGELIDAGCSDCHGSHRVVAHEDEDSPFGPKHTLTTCGACHDEVATEFASTAGPLDQEAMDTLEFREMDCLDCHNRPSHQFQPPQKFIDDLITAGTIPVKLPEVKALAMQVFNNTFSTRDSGAMFIREAVAEFYDTYYPDFAS